MAARNTASAADYTYSGSLGLLSAEAKFQASGSNLLVTLTNISLNDVTDPTEVLTAVYFNISGSPLGLTRTSAILGVGSNVFFGSTDPGNVVGGEWAFYENATGTPFGQNTAISSAGLGVAGTGGNFPGSNLQGPVNVDGLQYGITSAGDNTATGNAPVTGGNALIKNSVVFTLAGLPANFDPSTRISGVQFQYGTANCATPGTLDFCIPDYPEPASLALLTLGSVLLVRRRTR